MIITKTTGKHTVIDAIQCPCYHNCGAFLCADDCGYFVLCPTGRHLAYFERISTTSESVLADCKKLEEEYGK